ncbi:MAG: hypothetical protein QXO21_01510 [Candidatus Anstonellales archaeon]
MKEQIKLIQKNSDYKELILKENFEEAKGINTLIFDKKICAEPGQFVMLWLPGIDEKPFSIGFDNPFELTVARRGNFSNYLCDLEIGKKIYVRGPYGNYFEYNKIRENEVLILVAGSYGLVPLRFLLRKYGKKRNIKKYIIYGARTNDLLIKNIPKEENLEIIFTTDDGSFGKKGKVTDALIEILERIYNKFERIHIFTCGNEKMSYAIANICENYENINLRMSLERIMKCGIGICGHCAIGSKLCCSDGSIFGKEITKEKDFGKVWRELDGSEIEL